MLALFAGGSISVAQQNSIDLTNARDGETVEYCRQHKVKAEMLKNPAYMKFYMAEQAELRRAEEEVKNNPVRAIHTIPVVFHVLHNGGTENISTEQIHDAVAILNRDFRLQNADANNVVADFQGLPVDAEIEFRLATLAPDGTCFSGITRTQNALSFDGSDGYDQILAIANNNDVYQGEWMGDEYLNIFVVAEAGGAAGYTRTPYNWGGGDGMGNGIWILHNYVGSMGTGMVSRSRALTHEVGHWLNLEHPWGPNNNPGNTASCGDDDGVTDTPNTIGVTACLLGENTCGPLANVENYMDYSYCSKMFTPGQKTRMKAALASSVGGRNNIWKTSNLNATGATDNPPLCKAEFFADETIVCEGTTVNFTDESFHNVSGWTWSFDGGSPASSSDQHPTVTYNTPGTYTVSLTATDGSTTTGVNKSGYITVLPATGVAGPIVEGFESVTGFPTAEWSVSNPDGDVTFQVSTQAAATGSKSIKLDNSENEDFDVDELISTTFDFSNASDIEISFKYAFAQTSAQNTDKLQVYASKDCGQSWSLRKNITSALPTGNMTLQNWTPSASQWTEAFVTNLTSSYLVENFRVKFLFECGGGNDLYIDDINIFDPNASNFINENNLFSQVRLFPNPTTDMATLSLQMLETENMDIEVFDMLGKKIENIHSGVLVAGNQQFTINSNGWGAGVYYVNVSNGAYRTVMKLVVK